MSTTGGSDCLGGCAITIMQGMTVGELPVIRFRKPPLKIQAMTASASQTNTN
ncbi:MAG: hypothetical protein ABSA83_09440 [Verrucomicrobiota bacterium]|jgi:hypothetical protein